MANVNDDLVAWLKDAHAMEAATTDNLSRLIDRANEYPQLKSTMEQHRDVSLRQKEEIEARLKALNSDTSSLKDAGMRFLGHIEPMLSGVTSDDLPKHLIAATAWENFEIASYRSMLGAAQELGMADLATMAERFIGEEQQMAAAFDEYLPIVTRDYLRHRARQS